MIEPIIRKNGRSYSMKENKMRFFFPKEFIEFEKQLKLKQHHTVRCLLNTGARINEIRNVRIEDCDLDNKRITLRITKTKAKKGEKHGKVRTIPISSEFAKYLKKYFRENELKDEHFIGILSTPATLIAIKNAARKSNIDDWRNFSAHNLRKTLEVWLMALGVSDLPLTAHLGHDIKTAASHYVSPDIFGHEEKLLIRSILGDLYDHRNERY